MRSLGFVVAGLTATLFGALGAPGAAHAALPWTSCAPAGFQCATLTVPVDRSGATPGVITLSAARAPAPVPATTAVVALAGGPGQAALPIAADFKRVLSPLLGQADLLVYDQRGTGKSNPLTCAALALPTGTLATAVRRCAEQIGPARAFFTTAQSVEDIEALRIAGGYSKLVLYGVSYGTRVALAYAAAHPATTQALIVDSVVLPEGPAALRTSTLAAVPRVIGSDLCGGGACSSISRSPVTDIQRLAAKLDRKPLSGPVLDGGGRRYTATLSADGLVSILVAGDLDPTLRAELPGSMRAALTGDVRPILRLSARSSGLENSARFQQSAADSDALFFTTVCEESTTLPWTRGAPQAQREKEALAVVRGLPAAQSFGIFPRSVALGGLPSLCLGYPVAGPPPAPPGALPDVPVLVLDGQSDLRTPLEDAQALGARFPRASVIAVPHTGHSVLGSDPGTCAGDAVAALAAGTAPQQCPPVKNPYAPTPRPPASLVKVKLVSGFSPKVGRTLNAVSSTLDDARRQVIGAAVGTGLLPSAIGGLRNGSVKIAGFSRLTLRNYEYVPGVRVNGVYVLNGTTHVRVSGSAAAKGSLTFAKTGAITGRLGGRRVAVSSGRLLRGAAARPPDVLPPLAEALARGRLVAASR
ncbi:MAG: alpha/beta hydrolase [Solirubrobacterales bacterium]|nr:alpha/beta hydrolase [Solirubrobacterales bacterium]